MSSHVIFFSIDLTVVLLSSSTTIRLTLNYLQNNLMNCTNFDQQVILFLILSLRSVKEKKHWLGFKLFSRQINPLNNNGDLVSIKWNIS